MAHCVQEKVYKYTFSILFPVWDSFLNVLPPKTGFSYMQLQQHLVFKKCPEVKMYMIAH